MIYTPMTVRAMHIAYNAHHGQTDKGGMPYILHPVHLAEQMPDEVSACVALLHDVVEDTDWTLDALRAEFPAEVTDAIALMTHAPDEPYMDYVRRIGENPVARRVKLADLAHNTDETRLCCMPPRSPEDAAWFRSKYQPAIAYLRGLEG